MMLYSWLKIKFYPQNLLIIWIPIFITAFIFQIVSISRYKANEKKPQASSLKTNSSNSISFITIILLLVLCIFILHAFIVVLTTAPIGWDAYGIYFIKAQAFYKDGHIESLKNNTYGSAGHPNYPNLYPLIEAYLYYFIGTNNERVVSIIFPIIYSSILILLISTLTPLIGLNLSILTSIMIASLPVTLDYFTSTTHGGYMDMPLAFTTVIGIAFGLLWLKERKNTHFVFFSLIMGCLAWTKNEGIPISFIWLGLFTIILLVSSLNWKRKLILLIILLVCYLSFTISWLLYRKALGITIESVRLNLKIPVLISRFSNIKRILGFYWNMIQSSGEFMGIWILFLLCGIFNIKKIYKVPNVILLIGLICWASVYLIVLLASDNPLEWQFDTSADRLLFHLIPTIMIFIVLCIKDLWDKYIIIEQKR